jgi:predicted transcriptional regulator
MAKKETPSSTTIRVDSGTHDRLMALSEELNTSIVDVVRRALHELEQSRFIDQVVVDFEALRNDPVAWKTYSDDFAAIDGVTPDAKFA